MPLLKRFLSEEAGNETTTHAILIAIGAVVGLAVAVGLGAAAYHFFHHVGNCLNGC